MLKKTLFRMLSVFCAASLLTNPALAAHIQDYPDAAGHWAYDALSHAVEDELLYGDEQGRLLPSGSLTVAQMTAILNRVLGVSNTDRAYPGTPDGQWYSLDAAKGASLGILPMDGSAQMTAILNRVLGVSNTDRAYPGTPDGQWYSLDAAKGASLGILPMDGSLTLTANAARAEVFQALAAAFGLEEAAPDESVLDQFSDVSMLTPMDGSLTLTANAARAEVFQALAAAFGLEEAAPDESVLDQFSDVSMLTPSQRRAAAVLVRDGIVSGAQDGSLQASRGVTRAEFVSLIYRICSGSYLPAFTAATAPPKSETPAPDPTDSPDTENLETPESDTPIPETPEPDPPVQPAVSFYTSMPQPGDLLAKRVVLRGEDMAAPFTESEPVSIDRLVLATTGNDLTMEKKSGNTFGTIAIGGGTGAVSLNGNLTSSVEVTGSGRTVSLSGMMLDTLIVSGTDNTITIDETTKIDTLHVQPGVTMEKKSGNTFGTIAIGGGTGAVSLNGNLTSSVEVTGSGRTVSLSGMTLDTLIVSGTDNTIIVDKKTAIDTLHVQPGASNNSFTVDGSVKTANLHGNRTKLAGAGRADSVEISGKYCTTELSSGTVTDNSDSGLDSIQMTVEAPKVAPGGQMTATVTITGADKACICTAQWYLDGKPEENFINPAFEVQEGSTSSYRRTLEFTRDMPLTHTIGFVLTYQNPVTGETEKKIAGAEAQIENYPPSHYLPSPEEVLAKVHSTYRKGNTDYTPEEKTVFVNAKGYSSPTPYLLWVSRSAQKVNVFEGSKENWELIHEFDCATGAPGSSTPGRRSMSLRAAKKTGS